MNKKDIKFIVKILKEKGMTGLAKLLASAQGDIDESSTYGDYLFSTISQYLFYVPLEDYHQIIKISEEDKQILFDSVLYLYPHQAEAPEIRSVDFRVLREPQGEPNLINIDNSMIDHDFAKEQLDKCDEKIKEEDHDGAISSAGSLLEGVFDDIYKKCTGRQIGDTDDLTVAYKKIKSLLRLSDEQYSNESIKGVLRGLSAVVSSLDNIRNQLGDRHKRLGKPWKRHAKLCVNSAKVIVDFLYETLAQQEEKVGDLYNELVSILDSDKRFLDKDALVGDLEVSAHLTKYDELLKKTVKDTFIKQYKITRFRESDVFFAAMYLFFDQLDEGNINKIFDEQKNNNQACGLESFLRLVEKEKSIIASKEIIHYLEKQKKVDEAIITEGIPF